MKPSHSRAYSAPSRAASLKRAASLGPPSRPRSLLWIVAIVCLVAFAFATWYSSGTGSRPQKGLSEQDHRRLGAWGSASRSQRTLQLEHEVIRLSTALNVTLGQLQVAKRQFTQSETEHQNTRREYDKLLGELTALGHMKVEDDRQTSAGVDELAGQLQSAEERAAVAEFRTKQAAEVIASCERRVQGSGDEQDSRLLQLAVKVLLAPPAVTRNITDANGTVNVAALDHRAGVGAAEVLQQAATVQGLGQEQAQHGAALRQLHWRQEADDQLR